MTDYPELDLCPFCSSNNVYLYTISRDCYPDDYEVNCNDCGGAGGLSQSRELAIKSWNTRPRTIPKWLKDEIKAKAATLSRGEKYERIYWNALSWVLSLEE